MKALITVAKGVKVKRGEEEKMRNKRGSSSAGKYKNVKPKDFAGKSGGASKFSFPINDLAHARNALARAHFAPNPAGIKAAVYRKFPELKKHHEERESKHAEAREHHSIKHKKSAKKHHAHHVSDEEKRYHALDKMHRKEERYHHASERAMHADEKVHKKIEKIEHHKKHKHNPNKDHHEKKHEDGHKKHNSKLTHAEKKAMHHKDELGEGAKKRSHLTPKSKRKVVMEEFSRGTLRSGSGQKVTNPKQAVAIAYSEARRMNRK